MNKLAPLLPGGLPSQVSFTKELIMTAWVGLTGGIGSGKTQAAAYFSNLGAPIIDADAINKNIINNPNHPALHNIAQQFGASALTDSGSLNRDYIRQLIFTDTHKKQQLESILHPHIIADIKQAQQKHAQRIYGMIELPTLKPNSPFLDLVQEVLLVQSDKQQRIERIKQRNGFDEQTIHNIINNQITDEERLSIADKVLHNSGNLKELEQQIAKLHQIYTHQFSNEVPA
ncbi:dephospho-CoA kinase [Neisseriaceae bacterium B1]